MGRLFFASPAGYLSDYVADFTSEWWPASDRSGGRHQIGIRGRLRVGMPGRIESEFALSTDDMREAPPIAVFNTLEDAGAKVRAYDPKAMEQARQLMPNVTFCKDD